MNLLAAEHQTVGNPVANIAIFALFVVITLFVVIRAGRKKSSAAEFFTGRTRVQRPAERHCDRRRLPFRSELSRHRGRYRRVRLRRIPVLHWIPGGVAGGAALGRRIAAQYREIHHGRRAELPAQAEARAVGRSDFDVDRVAVLSAGSDGRRRRARRAVARYQGTHRPERDDRGGRCADDRLRVDRRYAGHHLGADHQGRVADQRCGDHDGDGAGQVRARLLEHPRLGAVGDLRVGQRGRRQPRRAGARRPVRRHRRHRRSTCSRWASRWCSAPPDYRMC